MPDQPSLPPLTVRAIRATPSRFRPTSCSAPAAARFCGVPLLLIDVETEEGVTGRSYLFCYLRAAAGAIINLIDDVEDLVEGDQVDPAALWEKLAGRYALIGVQGIVRMAMAGFDVACWDALAIAAGQPLVRLLGAEPKPIPAYNSCGLGLMDDLGALAAEAEQLLAVGNFRAVKLRLGYPTLERDIAAVHAVRQRIGDDVHLMVDYNQVLSVDEALVRGRALDAENIYWLEEPIRHDDYAGAARLARELKSPIQIGENFSLPTRMAAALEQAKPDYVMPDLERIGGVTGWRQAAELAAASAASRCRRICFRRSARICWRRRRRAITSNTSIGRMCCCVSRSSSSTARRSSPTDPAMAWCGTKPP